MTTRYKFAFALYFINAVCMLVAGLVYQLSGRFMPYHSDVIQTKWSELTENQQILYLGMMRTEAAGFLASSLAIFILLLIPFRQGQRWSSYAICAIGVVEYLPSAIATYNVSILTTANPPWMALFTGVILLLVALMLSLSKSKNGNGSGI
jgi:hypothetical protein